MENPSANSEPIKVYLLCTGVGIWRGGIETFFRECFDGIVNTPGLDVHLFKAVGPESNNEHRVWCLTRVGWPARFIGRCIGRTGYVIEQLTSFLPLVRRIRQGKPDILFTSDINVIMRLVAYRKWIGVPYRIIYSNGAPMRPPFHGVQHVQQVAPRYYQAAIDFGEPASQHSLVPYGITVPEGPPPDRTRQSMATLRNSLDLPTDRPIVISVGWVSATHKRMDHVVREVAALPTPRPFLLLLGRTDASTDQVIHLADEMLGRSNYAVRSAPYEQVRAYYAAADLFTLASLTEGFGRVYLEALIEGLPCIVHDSDVTRYVLAEEGVYVDMSKPGDLARALAEELQKPYSGEAAARRRESIRRRFSWPVLASAYRDMFRACMDAYPDASGSGGPL